MIIATYTKTLQFGTQVTYSLEEVTAKSGKFYSVTKTAIYDGEETKEEWIYPSLESAQKHYAFQNHTVTPENVTPETITYTTLNWQKVDGLAGEYTAPIDSTGFSMNISKTSKGYQVSTCEHDATDVMYYDELAYLVGSEWYTKTLTNAKRIAQDFLEVWNHNLAESPAN